MRCVIDPDRQSIFGDTYAGVPNPRVPHLHPYPTRYHGTNLTMVQPGLPYVEQPYAVPPFAGSLGESRPPLLSSVTGSTLLDAAVGAGFGYLICPRASERLMWTGIGAMLTGLTGTLGLLGTAVAVFWTRGPREG